MSSGLDQLLNYERCEDEEFYNILGCDPSSSPEQICAEYKIRALKLHPDKNKGDVESEKKFQLLQEAKETLCDPEKRKNYDKWRNCGISISYKQWLGMRDHVHTSMHWAVPKRMDHMLECSSSESQPVLENIEEKIQQNVLQDLKWGEDAKSQWGRKSDCDVLNKFRNYQI